MMQALAGFRKSSRSFVSAAPNCAVILLYHRVGEYQADPWALSVTPRHFAEHLRVLHRQYHPMRLGDLVAACERGAVPPNAVAVTFDDGYAETLLTVKPLLNHFDTPALVFVVAGALDSDREFWWDELTQLLLVPGELPPQLTCKLGEKNSSWELETSARYTPEDTVRYRNVRAHHAAPTARHRAYQEIWTLCHHMSRQERETALNELAQQQSRVRSSRAGFRTVTRNQINSVLEGGLFEIGAHTMTHPSLGTRPSDEQRTEIFQSKAQLESLWQADGLFRRNDTSCAASGV
jgi:peptidoglycan/xylan/chitin deacetylase (PgdA/CDA1 family)